MTTEQEPIGQPDIKELSAQRIAYIAMRGSYEQFPEALRRLLPWIEQAGAEIIAPPGGTYLDDPSTTPEEQLNWEVWAPVDDRTPDMAAGSDGIGVRTMPAGRYAFVLHQGPYETVGASYGLLFTWLAQQEIAPGGPPMEVYLSDPTEVPEDRLVTEVRVLIT